MKKSMTMLAAAAFALGVTAAQAEIKLGVAAEPYPPFAEKSAAGEWVGWEIEIGNALCEAMNEDCVWVPVAWDGIIPALLSKKIDAIMSSMSITAERDKTIDFSDKYYNTPAVIVAPKSSDISDDPASVEGKIVGVQVATTHSNYAEKHLEGIAGSIKTYSTFDEHNQDLVAGRIDAVIGDSLAMQPFLNSEAGACCEIKGNLEDLEIFGPGVGVGLREEDDELEARFNEAIDKIRADGTYDEISEEYFDFDIYGG